jgi:hypothetical protein
MGSKLLTHILFIGGMVIGIYGVGMIFKPTGFLVGGAVMVLVGAGTR